MKGIRIVLAAVLPYSGMASVVADERTTTLDLHALEATVAQLLELGNYTRRKLDSNMAKQILETYLESLDYDKLFFTQEDIDQIKNEYSSGLDDDILLGNLTPAKNIYEIFKQRVDQRIANINELLVQHYSFSSNRIVTANRAKEPWPANVSEADRIWRAWIEKELLEEKLSTSPREPGPAVVGRHYREFQDQIDHQDDEDVLRIFLEAVAQAYDPHSEYLGPAELNEFKIHTRLTISGIGVQIRMENGYARIDRIFPGGPAERSGQLHVGDMIVGVAQGDGPFVNTVHAGSDKIMEMVLGKDGSVVRLQLVPGNRKDPSKRRVVTLIRREVRLTAEEAQAELIEMHLAGCVEKLGWITVPSFYGEPDHSTRGASATRDVATLLARLKRERIKGLVIDLRNNAGGSVDEALKMAGMFINQGPIVQLKDSSGEIHVLKEQLAKAFYDGPMVVLENKLTASASEVFSAAMQDYRRAPIVGDSSSFGKGTVQAVIELDPLIDEIGNLPDLASALKITIEKIYRVTGESTQLRGVISDLEIPSLTESVAPGEHELARRLAYDEVAPAAFDAMGSGKPLFLDELRSRSVARIKENPLFHDLAAEAAFALEETQKNRVSLNEKVREDELAEVARLRGKGDSDRKVLQAHDRNKYYQLTLADVNRAELSLIKKRETRASEQTEAPDNTPQAFMAPPAGVLVTGDFDALTENEAITRETLNILSDLVNLTRARQMATDRREEGARIY